MLDQIKRKIVEWYVIRDQHTGKWGYSNRHPGDKNAGVVGPMDFTKAKDLVYTKNKEVET